MDIVHKASASNHVSEHTRKKLDYCDKHVQTDCKNDHSTSKVLGHVTRHSIKTSDCYKLLDSCPILFNNSIHKENKQSKSLIQCEVCVKNDECEREEQQSKKIKPHMSVLKNDLILTFGMVRNRGHILKLFQCTLYHPSHTFHTLLHVADFPKSTRLLTNAHVLVQRSLRCAQGIHCKYVNLYPGSYVSTCANNMLPLGLFYKQHVYCADIFLGMSYKIYLSTC